MTLIVSSFACGRGGEKPSAPPEGGANDASLVEEPREGGAPLGAGGSSIDAGVAISEAGSPAKLPYAVSRMRAREAAFDDASCREIPSDEEALRCLIEAEFATDELAKKTALDLLARRGDFVGVEEEQRMDGGFRGILHLVPMRVLGKHRHHLDWIAASLSDFDRFMKGVERTGPPPYRVSGLLFRTFESVGRTTPSAYAGAWRIGYNVNGSLLKSEDGVRETLFHEIFHLNDEAHGDWSVRKLSEPYRDIVKKCGTSVACLAPYAPNGTKVRGGTYYAFQPNNGEAVHEYAAELAVRYYREMRGELGSAPKVRPRFKCGPPPNAAVFEVFVSEFFGGVDLGPDCRTL